MQILHCNLWGVLPEEKESDDMVHFTRNLVQQRVKFTLKIVPENTDPSKVTDLLVGYNPGYNRMYISNLDQDTGLVWVQFDTKRLVYDALGPHIMDHRDSVAYLSCPTRYIREGFSQVMDVFKHAGFEQEVFQPKFSGDSLLN